MRTNWLALKDEVTQGGQMGARSAMLMQVCAHYFASTLLWLATPASRYLHYFATYKDSTLWAQGVGTRGKQAQSTGLFMRGPATSYSKKIE